MSVERDIRRTFDQAHVSGWLHVVDIDGGAEDAVARTLDALGLHAISISQACRDQHQALAEDLAAAGTTHARALGDPEALSGLRVLDSAHHQPRHAAGAHVAAERRLAGPGGRPRGVRGHTAGAGLQVWPHRLASGFPEDDIAVAGKTGTLPPLRSEAGEVELPGGHRYAAAVFTRSHRRTVSDPSADAAIGRAARLAVDQLSHT